jgi:hypothetical protein
METEKLDTETKVHTEKSMQNPRENGVYQPRNAQGYQKLRERPGTDPSQSLGGNNPAGTSIVEVISLWYLVTAVPGN